MMIFGLKAGSGFAPMVDWRSFALSLKGLRAPLFKGPDTFWKKMLNQLILVASAGRIRDEARSRWRKALR